MNPLLLGDAGALVPLTSGDGFLDNVDDAFKRRLEAAGLLHPGKLCVDDVISSSSFPVVRRERKYFRHIEEDGGCRGADELLVWTDAVRRMADELLLLILLLISDELVFALLVVAI